MYSNSSASHCEKLALVWSARRERTVAVRVEYDVVEARGCKIYCLYRMEELG